MAAIQAYTKIIILAGTTAAAQQSLTASPFGPTFASTGLGGLGLGAGGAGGLAGALGGN